MDTNIQGFAARGLPVLIGSLPLNDHEKALDLILDATPEIPLWPQLPSNPAERMLPQFAENIPCIVEENTGSQDEKIYFDIAYDGFDEAMLAFYEEYLSVSEDFHSCQAPGSKPDAREQPDFTCLLKSWLISPTFVQSKARLPDPLQC